MNFKNTIKIASLAIVFATGTLVTAQDAKFGVKGGVNFSNIIAGGDSNNIDDENLLTSYHAGIFTQLAVTETFYVQPELLYSRKGSEISFGGLGDAKLRLDYIELPVMFRIQILETINIEAGPYAAYLLDSTIADGDNDLITSLDTDDFRKLDYGLAVGAGFNLDAIEFGARYNYGLASISKNDNLDYRNSTLSVYVAFKL